jgi:integrase
MKAGRTHGVPLSKAAIKVLQEARKLVPIGDRVFQWNDKPVDDCNGKAFKDAVDRAGLTPLRWHDLRHTWASWAVQNGVTLHELMQLGGWNSYAMVLRYAHLAPDHLAEAAEKVSPAVAPAKRSRKSRAKGAARADAAP